MIFTSLLFVGKYNKIRFRFVSIYFRALDQSLSLLVDGLIDFKACLVPILSWAILII